MRSVVLIHGLLKGMGREEPCEMLAMKESQSEAGAANYFRCSVIDAPQDLPDGTYSVAFNGYVVFARKEGGLWIPDGATATVASAEAKTAGTRPPFRIEEALEILPVLKSHVA
ncbi:MAG: hypothetical protein WB524_13815 [Acidobacteriaceae bacterium]|jgi:hypothetical protein